MVTVLAVVTGVPALKLPETVAPVHNPDPPSKVYVAGALLPGVVSKLASFAQDTTSRNNNDANEINVIRVFFNI